MAESYSKRTENTKEKEKLLKLSNSPFSKMFSKNLYCRHVQTRAYLGKEKPFIK